MIPAPWCFRCRATSARSTPPPQAGRAILYHRTVLEDAEYQGAIACVLGGEASVATNGFWSALTMATTLQLPMVFYIEDNGYGISVPSWLQTPGGDIAANLASFRNLLVRNGDGVNPEEAGRLIAECVAHARAGNGLPCSALPCRGFAATRGRTPRPTSRPVWWRRSRRPIRCPGSMPSCARAG